MESSAMELQLGVFRFLPTTRAETNANKMRARSSRAMQRFTLTYLQAPGKSQLFWLWEKNAIPQIGSSMPDKDGAGSGISGLYLWLHQTASAKN